MSRSRDSRILFIAAEASFFVSHRLPLALAARERGYEVHVATPREPQVGVILQHGLAWHETMVRRHPNLLGEIRSIPNLFRLYRRIKPDLVHHIAIKPVLYGTIAARLAGVPAVVNAITGLGYAFEEGRERTLLGRLLGVGFGLFLRHPRLRIIFQNVEDQEMFIERGWVSRAEARLIRGSGVDPAEFVPSATDPPGPPLVIFAARLSKSKGVIDFVAAATILREAGSDARFAVVGEPDPDSLDTVTTEHVDAWRRFGVVEVWGRRSDMSAILRQASLFVLPTFYREGVPKVLIEAAASGIPSVTTDTPGCRDIVVDGQTGLLVPPHDVDALVKATRELLEDRERRRLMGRAARVRAETHFSLDKVIEETLALYVEVLSPPA